jgi:hypothetical protein
MAKIKAQEDKQRSRNHTYKTKDRVTRTTLKIGGGLGCSERVSNSCSTSGTRRVNLVTNPVISHEWGKDREVLTTSGTYAWLCVTQIFHSGQSSHGGDRKIFEVKTSTLPKGTLGWVASLQQQPSLKEIVIGTTNSGISYHLRDIYSICRCCLNVASNKWKVHNG